MEHNNFKPDFENTSVQTPLIYDIGLASDSKRVSELIGFVRAHYKQDSMNYNLEDLNNMWVLYQTMIDTAIKFNNLDGLMVLWNGIYYHDRDNPDYLNDVYVAAQFGNLKTFQHVLHGYMNYLTNNGVDPVDYIILKHLCKMNKDTKDFIDKMEEFVNERNEFYPLFHGYEVDPDNPESFQEKEKVDKFYKFVETYANPIKMII